MANQDRLAYVTGPQLCLGSPELNEIMSFTVEGQGWNFIRLTPIVLHIVFFCASFIVFTQFELNVTILSDS